ncbi:MAG TPA: hypothetical protein VFQ53_27995 [Kofleriaceae bacterium]|nr:hypothetical protein [Kofleriaceae bacterium]
MADWVLAVERAYVAAATGTAPRSPAGDRDRALAAIGAVASRYLAVGTPRSFGLIADDARVAALSCEAHRTWFQLRDVRIAGTSLPDARAVAIDEALACDIVCVHVPIAIAASQLRRGTHVNALAAVTLDDDLQRLAVITREEPGLGELAAGLVDGRQLDEITVFVAGTAELALAAVS